MVGVILATNIFETLFATWQQAGFFQYVFPFLLIFALVFGILTKIQLFKENKAVNAIIALVVGFMSLQFSFVSNFFSQIFPRVGVGLAIILVILILVGLFVDPKSNLINYVLLGVGVIIVIVVLVQAAGATGWSSGTWWVDNWQTIAGVIVIVVILGIVVGTSAGKGKEPPQYNPHIWNGK
jgi:hypothetical protein